ncbi:hypothetical protein PVAND_009281 [Polypedilum vanderplanki]|uniref:RING finger protein 141 n=1 Tax=Polypedilum vanderplanki TaxID=319348 RepID=A0A9J6CC52_POLVA|nr:hypothetical protein PVAND_009281 [Polypedilum vanderplanki]
MGQTNSTSSLCKNFIPETIDTFNFQIRKHSKIFSDLNDLTYERFKQSIDELNELSRKCIDNDGNQIVFTISKDSEKLRFIWKATVRIACVVINPETRKISSIKMINLKQFIHIFNTMVTNLEAIEAIEERHKSNQMLYPTSILNQLNNDDDSPSSSNNDLEECIICLDSKPDVILSCLHSYCLSCIEQWNEANKTKKCPICEEKCQSNNSWIKLDIPEADEINDEIFNQLQKINANEK